VSDLKPDRQRRDLHKSNLPVTSWKIGPVFYDLVSELGPCVKGVGMMRTSSTITRWQRRNKKRSSGLVVVGRRPCEPLNNPTLLNLGGGSHLKRESHPSPIGLIF
jgi:hypothetical protein